MKGRIVEIDIQLQCECTIADRLGDFVCADPEIRRVAIRSVLRWAAVIPSNLPRTRNLISYKFQRPDDAGRLVFLTSWGTLHTAFIARGDVEGHRTRQCYLRPAKPEECVGSIYEFPDAARFVAGLERSYRGGKSYLWSPYEIMPGFAPGSESRMATFDLDDKDIGEIADIATDP